MAAPLTLSPQHPRGQGQSLFSFLTIIDIIKFTNQFGASPVPKYGSHKICS